jgi:hypothetical protein
VTTTQALHLACGRISPPIPAHPTPFAQVSTFANLHVGVTTVISLMAAHLG